MMNKTEPTLILSPRFHSDSQDLWRAAVNRNWNIHRAINYAGPDDCSNCCVYGELLVADIMSSLCGISLLDPHDDWLAKLPNRFVHRNIHAATVGELSNFSYRSFIKPANDKMFQRGVYLSGELIPTKYIDNNCPVLVSDVVDFDTEYRFWCLDYSAITGDYYRMYGVPDNEDVLKTEAWCFANDVLNYCAGHSDVSLPSAVVLDVGRIENGPWAVVEANQCYASGIYGNTDLNMVLECVYRSAGNTGRVSEEDKLFIRKT